MIARLRARLFAIYRAGWFGPSRTGGFPVPAAGAGWLCMGVLIAALAACVALPAADRTAAAGVALAAYAAIIYWTYRPDA